MSQPHEYQCILVQGNLADGFRCFGPFESVEDATEWAEIELDEWWVMDLEPPMLTPETIDEIVPAEEPECIDISPAGDFGEFAGYSWTVTKPTTPQPS